MTTNAKLTNDPLGESVDVTLCRSMIGCLLYLTASHPNIAFSVGVCSKFQFGAPHCCLLRLPHSCHHQLKQSIALHWGMN